MSGRKPWVKPSARYRMNWGISVTRYGMRTEPIRTRNSTSRPGNLNRANPYTTLFRSRTAPMVEKPAMIVELSSQVAMPPGPVLVMFPAQSIAVAKLSSVTRGSQTRLSLAVHRTVIQQGEVAVPRDHVYVERWVLLRGVYRIATRSELPGGSVAFDGPVGA